MLVGLVTSEQVEAADNAVQEAYRRKDEKMAIEETITRFWVEVEPSMWPKTAKYHGTPEERGICNQIIEDIKRHVDNVDSVSLQYDVKYVCSYCGAVVAGAYDYSCCEESLKDFKEAHECSP